MRVRILDEISEINGNQWDNVVKQTEGGSFFHCSDWLKAIEDGLARDPKHVVVQIDGNPIAIYPNFVTRIQVPPWFPSRLKHLTPKRLYSSAPGFGGPIIGSKESTVLDEMFDAVRDVCGSSIISHRIRALDPEIIRYAQYLEQQGYSPSMLNCRFWFDLDIGKEEITNRMDNERRKEIRDAKSNDPDVQVEPLTEDNLEEFYQEYGKTMERVGGIQYPLTFFQALAEHVGEDIAVFTASLDGTTIGKHLCLLDDVRDSVHYFFNGVDEQYFEYSPSTLLHDYTIEWAIEQGYSQYDLGSTNANHHNGVFQYKSKFGCRVEPIYAWEKGYAPFRWWLYSRSRDLYRRYSSVLEE